MSHRMRRLIRATDGIVAVLDHHDIRAPMMAIGARHLINEI